MATHRAGVDVSTLCGIPLACLRVASLTREQPTCRVCRVRMRIWVPSRSASSRVVHGRAFGPSEVGWSQIRRILDRWRARYRAEVA